ncbi:PWWP domain-containing DNA repair factor 3A-like isoform X2 [Asterias amurensis]|uniref:PWWP domain-containing DNA repair factor 3A-like isoform X2 n=1 Tax=Asterias amurensis TaxID=7602 RepID=UPI003AB6B43A
MRRTRSNTAGSVELQSLTANPRKSRLRSAPDSAVVHVKMKAKKPKISSVNPHPKSSKPKKNSETSETKDSQSGEGIRKAKIISSDGLVMKLQQEAMHNSTRLNDREEDSESSGDEELPAIFDPSAPESKVKELAPGTVVWAKSKGWAHWPAVLHKFYFNNKKAWVTYFDGGNQRLQVSSRSLVPFSGPNRSKYLDLGRQHKHNTGFETAIERADDYLIKRGLGKSSDCNTSFYSELDTSFQSPPTSPHSETQCPISPFRIPASHDAMSSDQTAIPDGIRENLLSSDEELRVGFPIQNNCPSKTEEKLQEDPSVIQRQKRWIRTQNRLLKYILTKKTKEHLLAIYKGQTNSERHSLFGSKLSSDRQKLRALAGLGPITGEEQQSNLTDFLSELYKNHCMKCQEDLPSLAYITEVWLPEAVIFAIQKTRRIDRVKAEDLFFSEGVQSLVDLGEDIPTHTETFPSL